KYTAAMVAPMKRVANTAATAAKAPVETWLPLLALSLVAVTVVTAVTVLAGACAAKFDGSWYAAQPDLLTVLVQLRHAFLEEDGLT
ncbi:hypothetical protein FRC00_011855, partial [Tulasnella sp. 408]